MSFFIHIMVLVSLFVLFVNFCSHWNEILYTYRLGCFIPLCYFVIQDPPHPASPALNAKVAGPHRPDQILEVSRGMLCGASLWSLEGHVVRLSKLQRMSLARSVRQCKFSYPSHLEINTSKIIINKSNSNSNLK